MFRYFFSIVSMMYLSLIFYVGYRFWQVLKHFSPSFNKVVYWIVFLILSCSFILSRFVGRGLPSTLSKALLIIGDYWMIAVFYLFATLIILDFMQIVYKLAKVSLPFKPFMPWAGVIAILLVAMLLSYGTWNARNAKVTHYDLTISKDAGAISELRIVMVSDIHLSSIVNNDRLKEMVEKINELNPDVVFIPGDIIEDAELFIEQNMMETFRGLKAKYGVFISLGNHEYYGGRVKETVESLEQIGFHILKDTYVKVADSFYVVGREDPTVGRIGIKRKELKEVLEGVNKELPLILLNHQPIELDEAQNEGIDLQVSGHTHRGQVFPANIITSQIFETDWGYLKKENLQLVVTCGYGTWGPPIRIGNTPEIVEISISFKEE